jgi:hypothetical protein
MAMYEQNSWPCPELLPEELIDITLVPGSSAPRIWELRKCWQTDKTILVFGHAEVEAVRMLGSSSMYTEKYLERYRR